VRFLHIQIPDRSPIQPFLASERHMSRAFVRENDGDIPEDLPERPLSPHPNFVSVRGLRQIEERVHSLEAEREQARTDDEKFEVARIGRELRYWQQRRSSARLVEPEANPAKVRFGTRVTLQLATGGERSFTLVGEDEAEPTAGTISWVSPIGQKLLGLEAGDSIELQGQPAEVTRIEAG
jgi:transcription elongation GreA/GreB family factor